MHLSGKLKNGEITYQNPQKVREVFRKHEGKTVVVSLPKKKRSKKQQGYYFGAILPEISKHTGHTVEELHVAFKKLYLPRQLITFNGKPVYIEGSTTKLTTGGMAEFIMRIAADAAEMGIILPDPDEYYERSTELLW